MACSMVKEMKLKKGWGKKGLVMAVKNYVLYELRIFKRKQMSTYTYKDLFIDPYLLLFSRFSSLSHIVKELLRNFLDHAA